ncbi:PIG-M-domain-containing protein [Coniochaeta sp. 2T2.1]|nr:PIG-M-domain-containing protein [Coniochaeta sp. 2T2.1]
MASTAKPPSQSQTQTPSLIIRFFSSPTPLYLSASLLRLVLLLYGLHQDANSAIKYTDIDYLVFTDAARSVARSRSPYDRETYRYTPLLAWLLVPTAWRTASSPLGNAALFASGKVLFAVADLVAGWLIERILVSGTASGKGMSPAAARKYAAIWLLNPMVATISTRGSSEGLLGVLVMALLWAVLSKRTSLAGLLLGFGVHFKIYPFIYAPAIVWWMDDSRFGLSLRAPPAAKPPTLTQRVKAFLTPARLDLALVSLGTFSSLNILMYWTYGLPFITHTYLHHVVRIDHRHNFSPYNIQLYLASATPVASSGWQIESVAFFPQLLLSCVLIPLVTAKADLPTSMLAQTFAFVTFNKVCTSQYFLWYMVFLPLYLPHSSFLRNKRLGLTALFLWVAGQAAWLQQGYQLEFLGRSTFMPGLWVSSLAFFLINCWILGVIIGDVGK